MSTMSWNCEGEPGNRWWFLFLNINTKKNTGTGMLNECLIGIRLCQMRCCIVWFCRWKWDVRTAIMVVVGWVNWMRWRWVRNVTTRLRHCMMNYIYAWFMLWIWWGNVVCTLFQDHLERCTKVQDAEVGSKKMKKKKVTRWLNIS